MKVLVIGLGSMGRRRIGLIQELDSSIEIIGVDSSEKRCEEAVLKTGIKNTYCDLKEAITETQPDAAFVCTSPLSHHVIIDQLLDSDIDVFTELNLVKDGYERFIKEELGDRTIFLSSTFLYRKDVQWIIDKVDGQKVNYIYHTGQYLPDWHPWENFKNFFVGNKATNGCREIMAIEFPWIIAAFGEVVDIYVQKDNISNLELDFPDNFFIYLIHKNGSKGMIAIDVVSREATRRLEIYNEDIHVNWNGRPDSLVDYDVENKISKQINVYKSIQHKDGYSKNIVENAYKAEVQAFLDCRKGDRSASLYSFEKDLRVLNLLDEIEG
ncbi:MAG: Gfo/Idh/MocA family oxidoreductase [Eubacterium sp.]|nr:Gfo/Idh/MocA family oxidoreductase [Eubacterium sp.]